MQRRMVVAVVAMVAVLVRLVPVLRTGGLLFWGRYDDGVYYTASASLLDGRVPYRDFVLLHPPLIAMALIPFTLLGRLTTDPTGLVAARLAWMALSVVTAVLAARLACRWGAWPGLVAGLWCACSAGASYAGQTTFIEPVGDLALFGAVVLLSCDRERPRHELVAGALLGVAMTAKIWYVAPVAAVLVVLLIDRRLRAAARTAGVATVVAVAILLPFLVLAPRQMWHMVVFDQLSRPHGRRTDPLDRLGLAVAGRGLGLSTAWQDIVTVLVAMAFAVAAVACLRDRRARLVGAVAITCVAVLMASPVVFHHYGAFPAAPVGATLAIGWWILGVSVLQRLQLRRVALPLSLAAVLILLAGGGAVAVRPLDRAFPTAAVEAVLPSGCITADDPTALILTDRLSSDLRAGCDVAVDVTGASYGVRVGRGRNLAYQDWLRAYLRSGAAAIVARRAHDGLHQQALAPLGRLVYVNRWVHVVRP